MIKVPEDSLERGRMIQEAQQLAVATPVLFPLLQSYREDAIAQIQAKIRDGKPHELVGPSTQLYVIENMISDVRAKLEGLNLIGGKNGNAN